MRPHLFILIDAVSFIVYCGAGDEGRHAVWWTPHFTSRWCAYIWLEHRDDQGCQCGDRGKQRYPVQKRINMLLRILIVFLFRQE